MRGLRGIDLDSIPGNMDGRVIRCLVLKTGRGHECQMVGYPAGLTVCPRDGGWMRH
jgi:hypothetical protein